MRLVLEPETLELIATFERWAKDRWTVDPATRDDAKGWRQLVELGFFEIESSGGSALDVACALTAAARTPLPGPVVEADLAVRASPDRALAELHRGNVVTSVVPRVEGRTPVAGGARASLVIDRTTGSVLSEGPLPPVRNAFGLDLAWYTGDASSAPDPTTTRRWMLSAAAVTGGAAGALELLLPHVQSRVIFGKPLASFQAAQMRLAECKVLLEGAVLAVRDAGVRAGSSLGGVSAALAWIYASEATDRIVKQCHQLFGALGFCDETGLVRFSADARLLRLASPLDEATEYVMERRTMAPGTPPSLVLHGFTPAD